MCALFFLCSVASTTDADEDDVEEWLAQSDGSFRRIYDPDSSVVASLEGLGLTLGGSSQQQAKRMHASPQHPPTEPPINASVSLVSGDYDSDVDDASDDDEIPTESDEVPTPTHRARAQPQPSRPLQPPPPPQPQHHGSAAMEAEPCDASTASSAAAAPRIARPEQPLPKKPRVT